MTADHNDRALNAAEQTHWLADDPIAGLSDADDRLDRRPFVKAVASVMRRAYQPGGSSVFGLIGPWGSGKSSLIAILERELTDDRAECMTWRIATFNPWGYGDQLSLQWGFFSELRAVMPEGRKWQDAKKTLDAIRRYAMPAASMASVAHAGIQGATSAALDIFSTSPTKTRESAGAALRRLGEPILVIIDDLDRLSSSELLEVFKLVRFTGRLPNVYYLLSYDEQTLIDLLEKTDLIGAARDGRALDYLEKIVQVRFDVPPLRPEQVQRGFDDGLTTILQAAQVAITDQDRNRLSLAFTTGLRFRLDTPRSIRRFLGQVEAFLLPIAHEVNWVDFVLLSWIRTFEPGLYGLLQPSKELLLGIDTQYSFDQATKLAALKEAVDALVQRAKLDAAYEFRTLAVLAGLFPVVKNAAGRGQVLEQSTERGRINNPDYFDRFFQFGVPADDISDAAVAQALRDISAGSISKEASALESQLAHVTARALRKIGAERRNTGVDDEAIMRWLATRYATIDQNDGTFFNPQNLVGTFFAELLLAVPLDRARDVVATAAVDAPTAILVVSAVTSLKQKQFGGASEIAQWNERGDALADNAALVARDIVDSAAANAPSIFDIEDEAWRLIWRWHELQPEAVREFFAARMRSEQWTGLDLLARLVGASMPAGVTTPVSTLLGVREDIARQVLDLDTLAEQLGSDLRGAGPVPNDGALTDTPDHRRAYALAWLRHRRGVTDPHGASEEEGGVTG